MGPIKLVASKIWSFALTRLSPKVREWLVSLLTRLMDFLEKHFNNVVKHLFGIGGAGLAIGEIGNIASVVMDGATEKFSFFSRMLGIQAIFSGLNNVFTPYMTNWNCTFLEFFSAFGGITAINTVINSCAYALLFWLAVIVFKWIIGLLPLILRALAMVA